MIEWDVIGAMVGARWEEREKKLAAEVEILKMARAGEITRGEEIDALETPYITARTPKKRVEQIRRIARERVERGKQ
jgi:hypothetical protein